MSDCDIGEMNYVMVDVAIECYEIKEETRKRLLSLAPNAYDYDLSTDSHGEFREFPPEPDVQPGVPLRRIWSQLTQDEQNDLTNAYERYVYGV